MELPENPSILVLLVATDGATWLPDVLRGLRAQQHRPIKVLAVDNASSDGSSEILSKAFGPQRIVTLERRIGYGRALAAGLKVAAERNLDADAFLLLHDDAALGPGAVEAMVEAMHGTGAGIVGAKLVEWDDPAILQDIGQTTDRYGRSVPRVERGEIDQGQHEGIHDVLYATSAAMLIAREVVETVGLFDLRYVAMRDDLDLCWRARIAGYKTVIETAATARHASAAARDLRVSPVRGRARYFAERNMLATLIKDYSLPRLAIALPLTIAISFLNTLLFFLTDRRESAVQMLQALQWNIAHLPSTVRARARSQRSRREPDSVITDLMHHGATRMRAQFERAIEKVVGDVEEGSDEDLDKPPPRIVDRVRAHPAATMVAVAVVLGLIGARSIFISQPLAGTDIFTFPHSMRGFFGEFASGWRGPAAGGAAPATPGFVILGLLSFLTFGSGWLAERVLLVGLPLIAAVAMYRLGGVMELAPRGRRLAVIAYATTPVVLGAFGGGRLPDLVLAASGPFLILPLLRAAGVAPASGWRSTAAGIAGLAVATSLAPWSVVFFVGTGVVLAALCASARKSSAKDVLRRTATIAAGALVLLLPWSVELFRSGSPLMGGGADPARRMIDIIALSAGPLRPVPMAIAFGLPIAGLAGLAAVPRARRRSALILAGIAVIAWGFAWAVARGVPWIAPRPEELLVPAAIAIVLLAGMGFDAAATRLRARAFGVPHVIAGVAGLLLVAQVGGAAAWLARGDHPGLVASGQLVPTFLQAQSTEQGAFRVVWIDGSASEPSVALTGPEGRTMLDYLERPSGAAAVALRRAVAAIASNNTDAGGRLLATLGVRYVVVRPGAEAPLAESFARQVDLAFSQRFHDATVYENAVELPIATSVSSPGWVAAAKGSLSDAAGAEASPQAGSGFAQIHPSSFTGAVGKNTTEILLAEDFDDGWRARTSTMTLQPHRSFGWATRFDLAGATGDVRIDWTGQRWHRAALVLELVLVVGFAIRWSQRAARERGER